MLTLGFARQFRILRLNRRTLCRAASQQEVGVTEPRVFGQGALVDQFRTTLDRFARQTDTIGKAAVRRDTFRRTVELFELREYRGLMLEPFVSNKLQRRVYLTLWLYPGKPKRRLMRATEEVIEA